MRNRYTPPGYQWVKVEPRVITDAPDCYPWRETFVILPRITINKKLVWLRKVYKRRVWLDYDSGRVDVETQFAELFDILKSAE
jgi:hypothetical protein